MSLLHLLTETTTGNMFSVKKNCKKMNDTFKNSEKGTVAHLRPPMAMRRSPFCKSAKAAGELGVTVSMLTCTASPSLAGTCLNVIPTLPHGPLITSVWCIHVTKENSTIKTWLTCICSLSTWCSGRIVVCKTWSIHYKCLQIDVSFKNTTAVSILF